MSKKDVSLRDKWLRRLNDEDKAHAAFRKRARDADDAYCEYGTELDADNKGGAGPIFPLFPTTINLIHGRIYGRQPKPDVRKRHPSGPVQAPLVGMPPPGMQPGQPPTPGMSPQSPQTMPPGQMPAAQPAQPTQPAPSDATADDNTIAMTLERSLGYIIDTTLFDRDAHMAVNDFLITGLGVAKVEMSTETSTIPVINPLTQQPILDADGQPVEETVVTSQTLNLRHFHWSQFRWQPVKDWRLVKWVSFDHSMTRDDIEDQFNVTIQEPGGGTYGTETAKDATGVKTPQMDKYDSVYTVHEIWDKKKKKRLFIAECYDKPLAEEDDPFELKDFFPCPAAMMANVSGRDLLPMPDYFFYQRLIEHANELMRRIHSITTQVRDIAFYDKSFAELKSIYEYTDGSMIAVNNLLERLRSVDGKAESGSILFQVDMRSKLEVLMQLMQQLDATKSRIWEINGIADIQRGVSNPNETATAQTIKNQWSDIRTGQRVQVVALFFRDVFRIMAQIIGSKFVESQIEAMSGIMLTPNQIATLRSDLASCYAVDVESDSTMAQNDAAQQETTMAFINTFTDYMLKILPGVQSGVVPADLAKEGMMLIKDTFKAGRQLEQAVNAIPDTLQQLQKMRTQMSQMGQQNEQLGKQLQDAQAKLQQVDQAEQARENAKVGADTAKTGAETERIRAESMATMVDASKSSREDVMQAMATGIQ